MMYSFNIRDRQLGGSIEQPMPDTVKNTPSLWNACIEDAIRYGGELTREAIGAVKLRNDRKYVVVDTKVHMLMPGFCPAIPGWHTDGIPRAVNGNPNGNLPPGLCGQVDLDHRYSRHHLLITGEGCLTKFIQNRNVRIDIPDKIGYDLYKHISKTVNNRLTEFDTLTGLEMYSIPSCTAMTWDWWELHTGVIASVKEWRFLIRVTETDFLAPQTNLRDIIRVQQQVYVPTEFGW